MNRSLALAAASLVALSACTTSNSGAVTTTAGPPPASASSTGTSDPDATTLPPSVTTTVGGAAAPVATNAALPAARRASEVPWTEIGLGWFVVLYDATPIDVDTGNITGEGPSVLYLANSQGERYEITRWEPEEKPEFIADATSTTVALVEFDRESNSSLLQLLDLETGTAQHVNAWDTPVAGEMLWPPASLSRPEGLNHVVHIVVGNEERLERRSPTLEVLSTLFTQELVEDEALTWLYAEDGTSIVVGHDHGVAVVSGSGALIAKGLFLPAGKRCAPVRWWAADAVLAACRGNGGSTTPLDDHGQPHVSYQELWLISTTGGSTSRLTPKPEEPISVVNFGHNDAWQAGGQTFVAWQGDCGAAGAEVLQENGPPEPFSVDSAVGVLADGFRIVGADDNQLALYAWQGCDGVVGALYAVDLSGSYLHEIVPAVLGTRGVVSVVGLNGLKP